MAQANIRAYESDVHHQVVNIGSGTSVAMKELADLISPFQELGPARSGDAANTLADITRAREMLDWAPAVSFEAGLRDLKALMSSEFSRASAA